MRRVGLLAAGAALAAICSVAPASAYDGLFAPDSYRNKPLARGALIDPLSNIYVGDLAAKVRNLGVWVNTTKFSTPVYTVPLAEPGTDVAVYDPDRSTDQQQEAALAEQWSGVPLPPGAQPAAGTDKHLVVYQPSDAGSGTLWEFWLFDPNDGHPR